MFRDLYLEELNLKRGSKASFVTNIIDLRFVTRYYETKG